MRIKEYSLGHGRPQDIPHGGVEGKVGVALQRSKNGTPAEVWGETPKAENIF